MTENKQVVFFPWDWKIQIGLKKKPEIVAEFLGPLSFVGFVKSRNRKNIGMEWHDILNTTILVWWFDNG